MVKKMYQTVSQLLNNPRRLVYLNADAVPEAVSDRVRATFALEYTAGCRIDGLQRSLRSHGPHTGLLCLKH